MAESSSPEASYDVAVIGAGPAGATAAALLNAEGLRVAVFERTRFPRFVIGESLLPSCNEVLTDAGLFDLVQEKGYQVKTGAVFVRGDQTCEFDFGDQFTKGWTWTWQVPREDFDMVLARGVQKQGVPIFFEHAVEAIRVGRDPGLSVEDSDGRRTDVRCRFIIDASGYGRVLPRQLGLDAPSDQPLRRTLFTHVEGDLRPLGTNAGRTYVYILREDVWFWVIPFSNGRSSVGVVAPPEYFEDFCEDPWSCLSSVIESEAPLKARLAEAVPVFEPRSITGYSVSVDRLWGEGYCLVGNATEFLDPVFSSGIALALHSSKRAASLISRQLAGETVDWQGEYSSYLEHGIDTFRTYVNAWYDGSFHRMCFAPGENTKFKRMICSPLAGYVWDSSNPFVREHKRKLRQIVRMVDTASKVRSG